MIDWHRLFGLFLTDFFRDTCYEVEVEKDLTAKKQILDVVIVRKTEGTLDRDPPDGMEDLRDHNLITFKSHQEKLDDWAMLELIGHYVNYRKQVSPTMNDLLPSEDFRLFAVCARFPEGLAAEVDLEEQEPGVYDTRWGTLDIRIIVQRSLEQEPRNAMMHLFSAAPDLVRYGATTYVQQSPDSSTLIERLIRRLMREDEDMPYTMEDFRRDARKEILEEMTIEERKELLGEMLKGLSKEDIENYLRSLEQSREENGEEDIAGETEQGAP